MKRLIPSLCNGASSKDKRLLAAFGPQLRCAQPHAHESGAQLIQHLSVDFMTVDDSLPIERWKRLGKGWGQRVYWSGGRISVGAGNTRASCA